MGWWKAVGTGFVIYCLFYIAAAVVFVAGPGSSAQGVAGTVARVFKFELGLPVGLELFISAACWSLFIAVVLMFSDKKFKSR